MRLHQTEKYTIDGVVFHVLTAWGPRRKHQRTMRSLPAKDDETQDQTYQRLTAQEDAATDFLESVVVAADGLEDSDGNAVEWSAGVLEALPEPMIEDLISRTLLNRSDARIAEDPLELAQQTKLSQPEASTEATE